MDHDPGQLGAVILSFRLFLHVVTAITLVCYLSAHRNRLLPTLSAWLGGGGSMAAFFQGVSEFQIDAPHTQPWVMCIVLAFAIICVASRGNLAKPFNQIIRR
jgi:hypothetical protein